MVCNDCGIERPSLHKHHLIPRSQGGSDDPDNLVPLCANCHEDRHGGPCGGSVRGGLAHTPEAEAKKAAAMRALWQDPDYVERVLTARRASTKRDNYAIGRKISAAWTPEKRAAKAEAMRRYRSIYHWSTKRKV